MASAQTNRLCSYRGHDTSAARVDRRQQALYCWAALKTLIACCIDTEKPTAPSEPMPVTGSNTLQPQLS